VTITMSEAFTKAITSTPFLGGAIQGKVSARRAFLAGGVAATASAAVMASVESAAGAPSVSSDAELIGLCAQLDTLEREFLATDFGAMPNTPGGDHAEAEQDRIADAQAPIVDAICARPPQTSAGAVAVAHSLALWDAEFFKRGGPGGYTNERLIVALVRGLTGRAAA